MPLLAPVRGGVLEIGPAGMLVDVYDALPVGRPMSFVLGERQRHVRLRCVVRWCRLVGTERAPNGEVVATYRAGIAFCE